MAYSELNESEGKGRLLLSALLMELSNGWSKYGDFNLGGQRFR